jgi:hypothetical protein
MNNGKGGAGDLTTIKLTGVVPVGCVLRCSPGFLSGFARVVEWWERWSVGGMEMDFAPSEERLGRLLEACEIIPPAMASELVLEGAPEPLNQVALR